jgi:hypothetical protein
MRDAAAAPWAHAAHSLRAAPYATRLAFVCCASLAAAYVARAAHRRLPPGAPRASALLPLAALFLAAPALFHHEREVLTHVILAAALAWWANTKLLLLALGRGTLRRTLSAPQYAAALLLPVLLAPPGADEPPLAPRPRTPAPAPATAAAAAAASPQTPVAAAAPPRAAALARRCAAKLILLAAVCAALASPPPPLLAHPTAAGSTGWHPLVRNILFTLGLYTLIGAIMDGPAALAGAALGLRLAPHFAAPLAARGVADFWGRRWNLTAATLLRQAVFEPLLEGRACGADTDRDGSASAALRAAAPARRALAICATFAVRASITSRMRKNGRAWHHARARAR